MPPGTEKNTQNKSRVKTKKCKIKAETKEKIKTINKTEYDKVHNKKMRVKDRPCSYIESGRVCFFRKTIF